MNNLVTGRSHACGCSTEPCRVRTTFFTNGYMGRIMAVNHESE